MRVLVVGSGAREHALCARLASSPSVTHILCAPGNAGIAETVSCRAVSSDDLDALVALARDEKIDLVVIGPEAPLVAGLADRLATLDIACFGPSKSAARLEGSKSFAKDFMHRHKIPTARYATFTAYDEAAEYVRAHPGPVVIKADGLAAGKGVTVCDTTDEALDALDRALRQRAFGDAGASVVIEERLTGEEISFHVVTDGTRWQVLGAAQDHKRLLDGDRGPNTGGMGAYAPVPVCTPALEERIVEEVVTPTLAGLATDAITFRGVLFVGLMVEGETPRVLEYNVRFGDPECAILLERVGGDFGALLYGAATGALPDPLPVREISALGVVIAAEGYPDSPRKGVTLTGLERACVVPGVKLFHAGTRHENGAWKTAGGRVLLVTATADTLDHAAERAYEAVDRIELPGAQVRRDIGWRARTPGAE
jgi:phosphoribosylamine--glycine ligase